MKEIVNKETVDKLIEASKGMSELAKTGATALVDETIKLYVFYGIMGILKAAVVFVIFAIVLKFLNTIDKANEKPSVFIKGCKTASLVMSLIYFTMVSMPHVMDIGKALVAPNLFIAEKGLALVKEK